MREPGLERYWVPSDLRSALFGTKLMDDFFQVAVGGDIAFLNGVLKHLIERGWTDRDFVAAAHERLRRAAPRTSRRSSWERSRQRQRAQRAPTCCASPSSSARAKTRGVRLQHGAHPAPLRRRQREGAGQPGARARHARAREVRHHADPRALGRAGRRRVRRGSRQAIRAASRSRATTDRTRFETLWGAPLPAWKGHRTLQMLEAAHRRRDRLPLLAGRQPARDHARPRLHERGALARQAARPPGHRAQHLRRCSPDRTVHPAAARRRATRRRAAARRPAPSGASASRPRSRARASPRRAPSGEIPVRVAVAARPRSAPRLAVARHRRHPRAR